MKNNLKSPQQKSEDMNNSIQNLILFSPLHILNVSLNSFAAYFRCVIFPVRFTLSTRCNWFVLHLLSEDRHGIKFTLGWDRCKVKGIHSSQICDNLGWALIKTN